MAFKAYFDAGNQADSEAYDTLTLAGISGTDEDWTPFENDWKDVLKCHGAAHLHTTDLFSTLGAYKKWGPDKSSAFANAGAAVLRRHAAMTIGLNTLVLRGLRLAVTVVVLKDFKKALTVLPHLGRPEEICMMHTTAFASLWARARHLDQAEFYFDQGEPFYGHFLDRLRNKKALKLRPDLEKHVVKYGTLDMRSTPALQAADLLAWCVNRQHKTPILLDWQDRVLFDLSPNLRQMVKTHFSLNGELSHGVVA